MMNAYRTKNDQLVCITQIRCILFDSNMVQLSAKPIFDNKLGFVDGVQDFEMGQEQFLICCQVNKEVFEQEIDSIVDLSLANQTDYNSLVLRAKFSKPNACFEIEDLKRESMLLKHEIIENVYEYASNKLILSLYPDDILITSNWQRA